MAAQSELTAELNAEEKQADEELAAAVKNVDGIKAEIDAARKKAEGFYEEREAAIRNTQVHRIATTVEIVRGLIFGERPMSITATAKERGDILTDQISMVRIWVYPVLAFIVGFLPTLMVEIGSSTVFKPSRYVRLIVLASWAARCTGSTLARAVTRFCAPNAWPEKHQNSSPPAKGH